MSDIDTSVDEVVRISVVHADRRIDLTVPASLPLVEILPGVARSLGVLDPALLHGGYRLCATDGTNLDPRRSAAAQGIVDGDMLSLTRGHNISSPPKYDDVVHAVIDATSTHHRPWSAQDSARTSLTVSLTLIGLAGLLLLTQPIPGAIQVTLSAVGAVVLLTLAAVLSRIQANSSGLAFGLAGSVFGAMTGFFLAPSGPWWEMPTACAAIGLLVAGSVGAMATAPPITFYTVPMAAGFSLAIPSSLAALGFTPVATYALTAAVLTLASGAIPWLTLTSTRIKVISPLTEQEMFDDPPEINAQDIEKKVAAAQNLTVALQIAFLLTVLVSALVVVPVGLTGTLLFISAGIVFFFQARRVSSRLTVSTLVIGATVIHAATGLLAISAHPNWATTILIVLFSGAVTVTALSIVSTKVRIRLSALSDTLEIITLVVLLPLAAVAAGIA